MFNQNDFKKYIYIHNKDDENTKKIIKKVKM